MKERIDRDFVERMKVKDRRLSRYSGTVSKTPSFSPIFLARNEICASVDIH